MQETFISYKKFRFLWWNVFVLLVLTLGYLLHRPLAGANGASLLGFSYGIIAALGMFYLMWFGMRKRAYHAKHTSLISCLSAHVWLGVNLIFIVPLHCGFSFGYNIHTLAYVFMLATILSGIWGAVLYLRLPKEIQSHRGGASLATLLEQIEKSDSEIIKFSNTEKLKNLANEFNPNLNLKLSKALRAKEVATLEPQNINQSLQKFEQNEIDQALKLLALINQKIAIYNKLLKEAGALAWLKIWLYLHIPLSFAALAALIIHIILVLYYW